MISKVIFAILISANALANTVLDPIAIQPELIRAAPAIPAFYVPHAPPLSWAAPDHPERQLWDIYAFGVVNSIFNQLDQARDINVFCPRYSQLTYNQKIVTWAQFFTAISNFESSYDPTNRTIELWEDKGIDPITQQPIYSEGLLQLSYQDITQPGAGGFCYFNWQKDKQLDVQDLHRTILNPYINLYCGIHLMAEYIKENDQTIIVSSNYYWSTLQAGNNQENQVPGIAQITQQLPFCKQP